MASTPDTMPLEIGVHFRVESQSYELSRFIDTSSVLAQNCDTGEIKRIRVEQILPAQDMEAAESVEEGNDLWEFADEEWEVAQKRFQIIRPLIENSSRSRKDAEDCADEAGVHVATLYVWMRDYLESGHLSALVPRRRGRKAGDRHLTEEAEAIIEGAIDDIYLTPQRATQQEVIDAVKERCRSAGVSFPHPNTIRNRIKEISLKDAMKKRGQRQEARYKYSPLRGDFPGADFPLAVVQIDHTEADIIIVESETRLPMGRPWVTFAIDVFSRMIVGVAVSMEKPSAVTAGLCISNAILPKGEYLASLDVGGTWPVYGFPRVIHADNAKEFRGKMLERACEEHHIDLQLRPVGSPHYGGHIERYMGTTANELRKLPGTTFSNIRQRKGYDSEGKAALSIEEFEQYLVEFIVGVYHRRVHSQLDMPPLRKWEIGIMGDGTQPGIGLPPLPMNPLRVKLDFMPLLKRTVQRYGILVDDVHYYHEVLNRWINELEPGNPDVKRKFMIRRDPRDISRIYFHDPAADAYHAIPYRDTSRPAVSVWEVREARNRIREEGLRHVDENAIFETIARMRQRVEDAVTKTKSARRQAQRLKTTKKLARGEEKENNLPKEGLVQPAQPVETEMVEEDDLFALPIKPFDDLELGS